MQTLNVKANDVIFKQGDVSDSMYIVKSGLVGVYAKYGKDDRTQIAVLGKGKFFGEMGVIDNMPRSAEVVALDNCELIEIKAADFPAFVAENTEDVVTIMKNISERLRKTTRELEDAGRSVSRFMDSNKNLENAHTGGLKGIIENTLKWFGLAGKKEKEPKSAYAAGEILFEQGNVGTVMFRILEGEASVFLKYGKPGQTEVATLGKGAIFGEMAVIEEEKRTATVVAKTDVKVVTVANSKLRSFLTSHPEDALKILRNISSKLRETTKQYLDTLATIAKFVEEERRQMALFVGGDEFMTYATRYDHLVDYNMAGMNTFYDPYIFM